MSSYHSDTILIYERISRTKRTQTYYHFIVIIDKKSCTNYIFTHCFNYKLDMSTALLLSLINKKNLQSMKIKEYQISMVRFNGAPRKKYRIAIVALKRLIVIFNGNFCLVKRMVCIVIERFLFFERILIIADFT